MKQRRKNVVARQRVVRRTSANNGFTSVMRALESVNGASSCTDPLVEQLKQCPEAFKAGEMIGKMFESLKYSQDKDAAGDRLLPPAGALIPPLV
jgi:hypothetical protein